MPKPFFKKAKNRQIRLIRKHKPCPHRRAMVQAYNIFILDVLYHSAATT